MSKARSPRGDCSTTMGIIVFSLGDRHELVHGEFRERRHAGEFDALILPAVMRQSYARSPIFGREHHIHALVLARIPGERDAMRWIPDCHCAQLALAIATRALQHLTALP